MKVILNADDFGYSADTVKATIECFESGLLTSATVMAGMPAIDDALAFARTRDDLSFGVHLTFMGDGTERPLCSARDVAALVDEAGRFKRSHEVRLRTLARALPVNQIEREVAAQIDAVAHAGIRVTHVDSHRHIHKFALFQKALGRVLPSRGIRRVRTVQDVYLARPRSSMTYWAGAVWRRPLTRHFQTTDHFYMPATARDDRWHRVASLLQHLPGDIIEVGVHPGSREGWRRREKESLAPFVDALIACGHELVSWRAVANN